MPGQLAGLIAALTPAPGRLFPWVPVLIGIGVGVWFSLSWEPGAVFYGLLAGAAALALALRWKGPESCHPLAIAALCLAAGGIAAGARAHLLDAPILGFRYYGPVEGRVVAIDRSHSDRMRVTLDRVVLERVAPDRTPERVRISLHGDPALHPAPGMRVLATAHLSPPEGPAEPGGFDFQRMAYFDRLGAVGYSRAPLMLLAPAEQGALAIDRLRADIRAGVEARIEGDPGAFAAALVTGDRAGIGQAVLEDLRRSNLAHLLAISGLHMGLLTGFIFVAIRVGLALVPPLGLRLNGKKIAAAVALAAGAFYLALSGGNVATERAFVMVAVMLGAVLTDRRALSLRSVALAATILLLLQPESLLEPGFQMSFAATVVLIAGFAAMSGRFAPGRMPWWLTPLYTLFLSSLLAGLATAPVAAVHFNRLPVYGMFANLLAVPVMGMAVMPAAVIAGLLAPLGLEELPLWVMEQGTTWVLYIAHLFGAGEGKVIAVPAPEQVVLPLMALGAVWVILYQRRVRLLGLVPVLASLLLWAGQARPPVLVSSDGGMIGVMSDAGRVMSDARGSGFAVESWLENDGDPTDQISAAERSGFSGAKGQRRFDLGGWRIIQIKGKAAPHLFEAACQQADLVIAGSLDGVPDAPCQVLGKAVFEASGSLAIWPRADGGLWVQPARSQRRLWSPDGGAQATVLALPVLRQARDQ